MDTIEQKLKDFRKSLLAKDYPLGIDEILCEVTYLFEDDADVEEVMEDYVNDYYKMWSCAEKFYKVKDLIDEDFYSKSEDDDE